MRIKEYARNLQVLARQHIGDYLELGSKSLLIEQAEKLGKRAKSKKRKSRTKWEFTILREHPLTFRTNDRKFQVDVSGTVEGTGDEIENVCTLLRVWCLDKELCYRKGIDGEQVRSRLEELKKRVMIRFHFDRRAEDANEPEPLYHLQVGGDALDNECCWFPKQIDVPRFHFPPMDFVLLCELVLVNFFHGQSEKLRKGPEWTSLVRKSQEAFQKPYFERVNSHFGSKTDTLLEYLISW